jgi:ABC-type branched-subunit amino acid transport system substrate-binding protein
MAILICLAVSASGCDAALGRADPAEPFKIGLILNFSDSPQVSADRERAFDLALQHINAGGGVFGLDVESAVADSTGDPATAVAVARRLVEQEGVHAIVGPNASSAALPVARAVSGALEIPTISPSATSPLLTTVEDGGYFFRTALSDAFQGPVLADLVRDRGFDNVGLIYQKDAYGQGLADAFEESWTGSLRRVGVGTSQSAFQSDLELSADQGAQALVVVAFEAPALAIVGQAIEAGVYDQFVFCDASKRIRLIDELGGETLGGMYGTAGASAPGGVNTAAWEAAFVDEYGELPVLAYVKETYDAAIALAFAAQAAGSTDGAAIRDRLRDIGSPPGVTIAAGPGGVADGLNLLTEGVAIDFEGAANTLDWDQAGDLARGHIGIWRFTNDGRIEVLDAVLIDKRS